VASPYKVLGLDPDADDGAVVDAYRERVKEAHPDHGGSAAEFRRVTEAYQQLRDGEWTGPVDDGSGTAGADSDAAPSSTAGGRSAAGAGPSATDARDDPAADQQPDAAEPRTVEYLAYDALVDHGWDLGEPDVFERAADAGLDEAAYGELTVGPDETLLEAAERAGFDWPYACRGGACANCAVAVLEGDLTLPGDHVLPESLTERGIRLSCSGRPTTDGTRVVFDVKHLPALEDLRLPPGPFAFTRADE